MSLCFKLVRCSLLRDSDLVFNSGWSHVWSDGVDFELAFNDDRVHCVRAQPSLNSDGAGLFYTRQRFRSHTSLSRRQSPSRLRAQIRPASILPQLRRSTSSLAVRFPGSTHLHPFYLPLLFVVCKSLHLFFDSQVRGSCLRSRTSMTASRL